MALRFITAEEAAPYIAELENVSHRASTTGFYYNRSEADKTTTGASDSKYQLTAEIGNAYSESQFEELYNLSQKTYGEFKSKLDAMHPNAKTARLKDLEIHTDRNVVPFEKKEGWKIYECTAFNKLSLDMTIEFVSPEFVSLTAKPGEWQIISPEDGTVKNWVCDSHPCVIYTKFDLPNKTILRTEDPDYVEGKIRDTGR